jgi:hypothetical protein
LLHSEKIQLLEEGLELSLLMKKILMVPFLKAGVRTDEPPTAKRPHIPAPSLLDVW